MTFTFSGNYDPTEHGCFLDKLIFVHNPSNTTAQFTPRYGGRCTSISNTVVNAMLDLRDYRANPQLFQSASLYVATDPSRISQFAPPIQLQQINIQGALQVTNFVPNFLLPQVLGFDMDFLNSRILIRFDTFMATTTFDVAQFILQGSTIDPNTNQRVQHILTTSVPVGTLESSQTICLNLSPADSLIMQEAGICTTRDNCAVYFTSELAESLDGMPVTDRPPTNPLRVGLPWEQILRAEIAK